MAGGLPRRRACLDKFLDQVGLSVLRRTSGKWAFHAEDAGRVIVRARPGQAMKCMSSAGIVTKGRIMSRSSCSRMWQWYMYRPL
jgi:hypothetical protein